MAEKIALLVVDVQNDFTPGGELAVPNGDQVVPMLNGHMERFLEADLPIFASRDWHPQVTSHFKTHGGNWPSHCVQGTSGAEFHPELKLPSGTVVVSKGMDSGQDGYSAFDGLDSDGLPFVELLRRRGIERLYVGGLATDYCVKWSVEEALRHGFKATLLVDASLGVNIQPSDSERAIAAMVRAGADVTTLERVKLR